MPLLPVTVLSLNRRMTSLAAIALVVLAVPLAPFAMAEPAARSEAAPAKDTGDAKPAAAGSSETAGPAAEAKPAPAAEQAAPQVPKLPEIQEPVAAISATIESLEKAVERRADDSDELANLRFDIDGLISGADLLRSHFNPRLADVRSQVDKLGPTPAKDQPPESPQLTAERDRLNAISAEIVAAIRTVDLVEERARQLSDKVQGLRQSMFASRVLARSKSPLAPTTWKRFTAELPGGLRQLHLLGQSWIRAASGKEALVAALLVAVALAYVILKGLARVLLAARLDRDPAATPRFFVRTANATWVAPVVAAPAALAGLALVWGLDSLDLLVHEIGKVTPTLITGAAIFIAVRALATAILQPARPRWRLVNLADKPARTVRRTVSAVAAVYGTDLVLSDLAGRLFLPLPVTVMIVTLSSVAIGLLLLHLVRVRFTPLVTVAPDGTETPYDAAANPAAEPTGSIVSIFSPRLIKLPLLAIALFILGAVALGYVALGRFVAGQVIATGSAAVVVMLAHLAIRALMGAPGSGIRPFHTILSERAGLSEEQSLAVERGLTLLLDAALAVLALPLILLTWGYSLPESFDWLKAAVFGFEIGQFKISFARIVLAILLFMALLFATRLVQRWLSAGPLQSAKIDRGIANSIHTAVGYAGFVLAALVAISYGGLDVTSFAIVAGALSVGIGFGLQSIINNFVSGLILLVERPIKVGDLVAVGGREGRVRSIAVRSTEIETGDKASVIVPNSELITGTVTNWTHRNALGRVAIKVMSSYSADPEDVCAVLRKVAADCPLIMQHPTPGVSFDNFGLNGFEYSLTGVVSDVSKAGAAQTDLRLRIVKAFRAAGIEMPHAQSDVHLRDLDKLWAVIARVMAERAAGAASAPPSGAASSAPAASASPADASASTPSGSGANSPANAGSPSAASSSAPPAAAQRTAAVNLDPKQLLAGSDDINGKQQG